MCWDKDGLEFSTSAEPSRFQLLRWIVAQKESGIMNKISYTRSGISTEVSFPGPPAAAETMQDLEFPSD